MEDGTVEEIAENIPVLDDAAKDRITTLCEEKLRLREMNTNNEGMVYAGNVQNITRTQWFRPVMTAAACLVLAAGVGGMMLLGGGMPTQNPQPPVNSGNEDTTAAAAESTETNGTETNATAEELATVVTVTETVISGFSTETTTAVSAKTTASTETVTAVQTEETAPAASLELSTEQLRELFDRNVRCLEHFVLTGLGTQNEALDGAYIYEVASSEYGSFAELESFVYSTYTDSTANQLLTNFPLNGPMYLEYDGKLCMDTWYALGGLSYEIIWAGYRISNPAAVDENTIAFDVTADTIYDSGETVSYTCKAIREADGWRLEKLYGYEKVEQELPEKPDTNGSALEEALTLLVQNAMQLCSDYPTKGEALPGTSLYEVDFENWVNPESCYWDYPTFESYLYDTFTPETAEWVLNDSIFKGVDGKLYLDVEKAAYIQGPLVDWSEFSITVDTMTEAETGNICTFRAVASDDPAVQFPYTTLEDRTNYYTAQAVEGLGWRLSEKPEYLLK